MAQPASQLSLFDLQLRGDSLRGPAVQRAPSKEVVSAQAKSVALWLSRDLGVPVRLAVTDNRSSMVSFRKQGPVLSLRLHHMFLSAPENVLKAVADYAGRGSRRAGPTLDHYIRGQEPLIRRVRRPAALSGRGSCFDLQEIFNRINAQYFQGGIRAEIGWGRAPKKRRRRSIRLGVYDHQTREIRIHPALDKPLVPLYFVEFIVFHEMLHQLFPTAAVEGHSLPRQGRRRHIHHPPAFRDREKSFPLYEKALRWERDNLQSLLRS